jgi:hypothetical protein
MPQLICPPLRKVEVDEINQGGPHLFAAESKTRNGCKQEEIQLLLQMG